jgi:hypothetical protein
VDDLTDLSGINIGAPQVGRDEEARCNWRSDEREPGALHHQII